jgi:hypothetical protein
LVFCIVAFGKQLVSICPSARIDGVVEVFIGSGQIYMEIACTTVRLL